MKLGEEHRKKLYAIHSVTGKLEVTSTIWSICFMEIDEREKIPINLMNELAIWNVAIGHWVPWRNIFQILNNAIIVALFPVTRSIRYIS